MRSFQLRQSTASRWRRAVRVAVLLAPGILTGIFSAALPALQDGDSFGHWLVRCGPNENDDERGCFLFQNLVLKEGGQRVLQVAVGFVSGTDEPIALLSLPLGISLPPGAIMQIDETEQFNLQVERCEVNGCRAGLKLSSDLINRFRNGSDLSVTFFDGKRRPIEVPLSLEGFARGYQQLLAHQRNVANR